MLRFFQLSFLWCFSFIVIIITIVNIKLIGSAILKQEQKQQQCPGSNVDKIREQTKFHEISILFYYTSWNEKSLHGRKLINDVADYYNSFNIYFATIDCWHLACNCTRTYDIKISATATPLNSGSPYKWPTLMLYVGVNHQIQLEYHGEWEFEKLCAFINNALKPLERINAFHEMDNARMEADAIILSIFEHPYNYEYKQYAMAALRWLENDPLRSFRFVVSFNQTIINILQQQQQLWQISKPFLCFMNGGSNIRRSGSSSNNDNEKRILKCFNSTNTDEMLTYNTSNILRWLQQELKNVKFIHGYSTTPPSLTMKLKFGPVLSIFPYSNDFYEIMEKVIYESSFQVNNKNDETSDLTIATDEDLKTQLSLLLFNQQQRYNYIARCVIFQNSIQPLYFLKYYYTINIILKKLFYGMVNNKSQHMTAAKMQDIISASTIENNLQNLHQHMKHLVNNINYKKATSLHIAVANYLQDYVHQWQQQYKYNRTISIVIIDHNKYPDYLPSLGITNDQQLHDKIGTTCLVDNDKESIYIMTTNNKWKNNDNNNNETIINALEKFLHDFFHNNLMAFTKVEALSHKWQLKKPSLKSENLNTEKKTTLKSSTSSASSSLSPTRYYLTQLNSSTFSDYMQYQQHNITTVVLLYTSSCVLCANLQNTFLQLANMLRHQENYIRFFRINTQTNDMPWQFVMPMQPSLLVFSKGDYSDSRIFPSYLQPNIRNVLAFILGQMSAVDKVKLIVTLCETDSVLPLSRNDCWHFVNDLLIQYINQHLYYWQLFDAERHIIFERLSAFKDLSLIIQRNLRLL